MSYNGFKLKQNIMAKKASTPLPRLLSFFVVLIFLAMIASVMFQPSDGRELQGDLQIALGSLRSNDLLYELTGPYNFDASASSAIDLPSSYNAPTPAQGRTIEFGVWPFSRGSNYRTNVLYSSGDSGSGDSLFNIGILNGDIVIRSGSDSRVRFNTNLSDEQFSQVVVSVPPNASLQDIYVYIDDQGYTAYTGNDQSDSISDSGALVRLGGSVENSYYFDGSLRTIRVYDRAIILFEEIQDPAPTSSSIGSINCGNAIVEGAEQCDDGNVASGDGCNSACQNESGWRCLQATVGSTQPSICTSICGDSIVVGLEQCDDGARIPGDGCSRTCQREAGWLCGDGTAVGDEECDDGNTTDGDGCSSTCTRETPAIPPQRITCGNGIVEASEQCDDQNAVNGDGCFANCVLEVGWNCVGQPSLCTPSCGDGIRRAIEQCDDGNTTDGDGCSASCQNEACGDGVIQAQAGETCDDGNNDSNDGCDAACQLEVCGDSIVQDGIGEVCDDGNILDGDGCSSSCTSAEACGNLVVDALETCDDGNILDGDGCSSSCQVEACGDSIIQSNEVCDDGNQIDGDGCSSDCQVIESCGNGVVDTGEECDDGNTVDTDTCTIACKNAVCGDGIVSPANAEECDDGNPFNEDGCSSQCLDEYCGDGVRQIRLGEQCDDGDILPGDGCDGSCLLELGALGCTSDADCGGLICDTDGSCVQCQASADCAEGEFCQEDNTCIATSSACSGDSDCFAGDVCQNSACFTPPVQSCFGEADTSCTHGRTCAPSVLLCLPITRGQTCNVSSDCGPFEICDSSNQCAQNLGGCASNTDCSGGQVCNSGVCEDTTTCTSNDDCFAQEICLFQTGTCFLPPVETCTSEQDSCSFGRFCDLISRKCSTITRGQKCNTHTDCRAIDFCSGLGVCVENFECYQSADCADGEVCDFDSLKCEPDPCPECGDACTTNADCGGETCFEGVCVQQ